MSKALIQSIRTRDWYTANRLVTQTIAEKLSIALDRERRTLTENLIAEASAMPVNWQKGWQWPWQIGGGGSETPYIENGRWKLYVFNAQERKHYVYDFDSDMFEDA